MKERVPKISEKALKYFEDSFDDELELDRDGSLAQFVKVAANEAANYWRFKKMKPELKEVEKDDDFVKVDEVPVGTQFKYNSGIWIMKEDNTGVCLTGTSRRSEGESFQFYEEVKVKPVEMEKVEYVVI